jgi:tetratricopeptide (TPR) repeat protein
MPISVCKNISLFCLLCVLLLGLGGCAVVTRNMPAPPLPLTSKEEARIGAAAEARLLQLLGGPYNDETLVSDLRRLCDQSAQGNACKISVADRSVPAVYSLPGGRIILTRGLLTEIHNHTELDNLLAVSVQLSNEAYSARATMGMNEAIREFLANADSPYDPDSASIRMARLFERTSCAQGCLDSVGLPGNGKVDPDSLPASVRRLTELRPGYELLVRSRAFEAAGNHAQAIASYLQAATISPDEPRILGALGLAYLRAGELQSARLYLQRVVILQPDYYQTLMGLGYCFLQSQKNLQADKTLTKSVGLLPVPENLFLLAEAREKTGDLDAATALYQQVVEEGRNSKFGRTAAGRLAKLAGGQ